jgi:hypothetical protein
MDSDCKPSDAKCLSTVLIFLTMDVLHSKFILIRVVHRNQIFVHTTRNMIKTIKIILKQANAQRNLDVDVDGKDQRRVVRASILLAAD